MAKTFLLVQSCLYFWFDGLDAVLAQGVVSTYHPLFLHFITIFLVLYCCSILVGFKELFGYKFEILHVSENLSSISIHSWWYSIWHHLLFLLLFLPEKLKFFYYFFQTQCLLVHEQYLDKNLCFFCYVQKFPFMLIIIQLERILFCVFSNVVLLFSILDLFLNLMDNRFLMVLFHIFRQKVEFLSIFKFRFSILSISLISELLKLNSFLSLSQLLILNNTASSNPMLPQNILLLLPTNIDMFISYSPVIRSTANILNSHFVSFIQILNMADNHLSNNGISHLFTVYTIVAVISVSIW